LCAPLTGITAPAARQGDFEGEAQDYKRNRPLQGKFFDKKIPILAKHA
jgi:hypothetical protein